MFFSRWKAVNVIPWTSRWCTLGWKTTTPTATWENWRPNVEAIGGSHTSQMTSGILWFFKTWWCVLTWHKWNCSHRTGKKVCLNPTFLLPKEVTCKRESSISLELINVVHSRWENYKRQQAEAGALASSLEKALMWNNYCNQNCPHCVLYSYCL